MKRVCEPRPRYVRSVPACERVGRRRFAAEYGKQPRGVPGARPARVAARPPIFARIFRWPMTASLRGSPSLPPRRSRDPPPPRRDVTSRRTCRRVPCMRSPRWATASKPSVRFRESVDRRSHDATYRRRVACKSIYRSPRACVCVHVRVPRASTRTGVHTQRQLRVMCARGALTHTGAPPERPFL